MKLAVLQVGSRRSGRVWAAVWPQRRSTRSVSAAARRRPRNLRGPETWTAGSGGRGVKLARFALCACSLRPEIRSFMPVPQCTRRRWDGDGITLDSVRTHLRSNYNGVRLRPVRRPSSVEQTCVVQHGVRALAPPLPWHPSGNDDHKISSPQRAICASFRTHIR